jgi:hypothetical protein
MVLLLSLGTRLYFAFYDLKDDTMFNARMDALCEQTTSYRPIARPNAMLFCPLDCLID